MKELIDFLHSSLGITMDGAAAVIITLFAVFLAAIFNEIISGIKLMLKRKSYRQLFKINLLGLMKGLYRQAVSNENYSKQLDIEYIGSFRYKAYSIAASGIITAIGYENLNSAFFDGLENVFSSRKKRMAFNNIWEVIEYLNVFHKKSFEEAQSYHRQNNEINEQRNKSLGVVNQITDRFLILYKHTMPENLRSYVHAIDEMRYKIGESEDMTAPKAVEETLIQPLLAHNRKNIEILRTHPDFIPSGELTTSLLDCSLRYKSQVNLAESYQDKFTKLKDAYYSHFYKIKRSSRELFKPNLFNKCFKIILVLKKIIKKKY
ncbi:MAG: hypothetical protein ACOH2A_02120 [Sphingobacteriaceae bacterium]